MNILLSAINLICEDKCLKPPKQGDTNSAASRKIVESWEIICERVDESETSSWLRFDPQYSVLTSSSHREHSRWREVVSQVIRKGKQVAKRKRAERGGGGSGKIIARRGKRNTAMEVRAIRKATGIVPKGVKILAGVKTWSEALPSLE